MSQTPHELLRWPYGVECPRCGSTDIRRCEVGRSHPMPYRCRACAAAGAPSLYFSIKRGTVMHNSHRTVQQWILIAKYVAAGVTVRDIARRLKVHPVRLYSNRERLLAAWKSGLAVYGTPFPPVKRRCQGCRTGDGRGKAFCADCREKHKAAVDRFQRKADDAVRPIEPKAPVVKRRACLKCRRSFMSEGVEYRLCPNCRHRAAAIIDADPWNLPSIASK